MKVSTLVLAGFVVVGMCRSLGAQTSGDEVVSKRVDELVLAQMREQKIPGVSLAVMRDGKIIKATRLSPGQYRAQCSRETGNAVSQRVAGESLHSDRRDDAG